MKLNLKIDGMGCEHCIKSVREALEGVNGVKVLDVKIGSAEIEAENDLHERLKRAVEKQMQVTVNDLAVNGKDLIELGFTGTEIGQIKKELLDKYLSEELQNEKEEMLNYVKEKYKK